MLLQFVSPRRSAVMTAMQDTCAQVCQKSPISPIKERYVNSERVLRMLLLRSGMPKAPYIPYYCLFLLTACRIPAPRSAFTRIEALFAFNALLL